MSTDPNQSDRADGRSHDLAGDVLGWLSAHEPLTDRLEYVDGIDDGTTVIMPHRTTNVRRRRASGELPGVVVAVRLPPGSSNRENRQERTFQAIRVIVEVRERAFDGLGTAWGHEVLDEIKAVLTTHHEGWLAPGLSGGQSFQWNDQIDREVAVVQCEIQSWG
jgi:hypothetical protein